MPTPAPIPAQTQESQVENTIPVLWVSDVSVSIRFYCEVLGFKLDWGGKNDTPHIASVSRDGQHIMLELGKNPGTGCVWIGGSILVSIWDKVRSNDQVKILKPPTNEYWALDMRIADPDGNILWFGTENLKDVAFGTEPADHLLPRQS
jgi:catechol 2,3-dioxygenase-like lactoylglutathione lyase family enzyme